MTKPGSENNAFKHGAFSEFAILPGENAEEFERLHQSLIMEWSPVGALEEEVVLTLAQCIQQKRRAERYYRQEMIWAEQHPDKEKLNNLRFLCGFLDHLQSFEDAAELISNLPDEFREWINSEYPRSQFKDAKSWIDCLKEEMPKLIQMRELAMIRRSNEHSFKAEKAAQLRELMAKKIALDERLDSRIDKSIKGLAQAKALKSILAAQVVEPKQIHHQDTRTEHAQ